MKRYSGTFHNPITRHFDFRDQLRYVYARGNWKYKILLSRCK